MIPEKPSLHRTLLPVGAALVLLSGAGIAAGCQHSAASAPDAEKSAASSASGDSGDKAAAADTSADDKGKDAGTSDATPTVSVATVHTGVIEKTLPVTGTLAAFPDQEAILSPPTAGILDALPVRLGQTVTRGQMVAHLSTRTLQGQIQQAQATIAQNAVQVAQARANALQQQGQTQSAILQAQSAASGARATLAGAQATLTGDEAALTSARQSLTRTQSLFRDGLVAQKDVEAAQLAVHTAEAQVAAQRQTVDAQRQTVVSQDQSVQAARAAAIQDVVKRQDIQVAQKQLESARGALATARAQEALYTIHAPLSGIVTTVGASMGEAVDTSAKLLTIANLDRLQLQIAVPSASASAVRAGQPVLFTVDSLPGHTFRSVIRTVGTQVDPANSTITAYATVDNPKHVLKDDLSVKVQIVTAQHTGALLVPRAALLIETSANGSEASVLRLGSDGAVHKTAVTTGVTEGDTVEILSGVHAGDRIATTGAYGLPDGTKVQVAGAGGKDKDAAGSDKAKSAGG